MLLIPTLPGPQNLLHYHLLLPQALHYHLAMHLVCYVLFPFCNLVVEHYRRIFQNHADLVRSGVILISLWALFVAQKFLINSLAYFFCNDWKYIPFLCASSSKWHSSSWEMILPVTSWDYWCFLLLCIYSHDPWKTHNKMLQRHCLWGVDL